MTAESLLTGGLVGLMIRQGARCTVGHQELAETYPIFDRVFIPSVMLISINEGVATKRGLYRFRWTRSTFIPYPSLVLVPIW